MRNMLWIVEAVETGVDTENYPRAMYQASLEIGEQQQQKEGDEGEDELQHANTQEGLRQEDGGPPVEQAGNSQERTEREREEQQRHHNRQYPESPKRRRTNPDSATYGGWDVIDNLTVTQGVVRPPGMQTIEFITNSL